MQRARHFGSGLRIALWVLAAGAFSLSSGHAFGGDLCDGTEIPEGEPVCADEYIDMFNGGPNSTPPGLYSDILCGDTICGETGTYMAGGELTLDTDWYSVGLLEPQEVTWAVVCDNFPHEIFAWNLDSGSPVGVAATSTNGEEISVTNVLGAGSWAFYVAPVATAVVSCGSDYIATLTCGPPPQEACCMTDGSCTDAPPSECEASGGLPMGTGTDCTSLTCFVDLALRKTELSTGPYFPGSSVTFEIEVINQGTIDVTDVEVTDYLSADLILDDDAWTSSGSVATRTIAGRIDANGGTATGKITFIIDDDFAGSSIVNYAEISAAANVLGLPDVDSVPDQDDTNDAGGQPGSEADDFVDGDGTGVIGDGVASTDEDDHDPAQIEVLPFRVLSIQGGEAAESAGEIAFILMLSEPVEADVSVDVTTMNGSAAAGSDYTALSSMTFTIPMGTALLPVPVSVMSDEVVEADETFTAQLSGLSDSTSTVVLAPATDATWTIINDDMATLTIEPVSLPEGDVGPTNFDFLVTLDNAVQDGFDVTFNLIDGTATDADDFDPSTVSPLTFNGDAAEIQTIRVVVDGDMKVEGNEKFTVALDEIQFPTGAGGVDPDDLSFAGDGTAVGDIMNDDTATLTLVPVVPVLNEGSGGTTSDRSFTVELDAPVQGGFMVAYTTNDDTATAADGDYVDQDGSLAFGGTVMNQPITVAVNHDDKVEADEEFTVALGALSNLAIGIDPADITIAGSPQVGTILNDDQTTVTLSPDSALQDEGTGGTTTAFTFNVSLSNPVQGGFDLDFSTDDDTATVADGDYVDNDGTLPFAGGANEQVTITVQVNHDSKVEADEVFRVALGAISNLEAGVSDANVAITGTPQDGNIGNDDEAMLTIVGVTQNEGTGGTTNFDFDVTLDNGVQGGLELAFNVNDGTATDADDFDVDTVSPLVFAGGISETQTVRVIVDADMKVEADELFEVAFGAITNLEAGIDSLDVTTAGGPATGNVLNDDTTTLTISSVDKSPAEGTGAGSTTIPIAVTLSNPVQGGFDLAYATNDGTAMVADNDYTDNDGTFPFAGTANEVHGFDLDVTHDNRVELDETFTVSLGAIANLGIGIEQGDISFANQPLMGTIENDDTATISIGTVSQFEEQTSFVIPLSISAPVDVAVTFDLSTIADTAMGGGVDYTDLVDETVTFPADSTANQTVTVIVIDDTIVEFDETFGAEIRNLQSDGRAVFVATGPPTATILNNPLVDAATISIADLSQPEESTSFNFVISLSNLVATDVTVDLTTAPDSALGGGVDYQNAAPLLVTIPANTMSTTGTVTVVDDIIVELDETFDVTLSNIAAAGLPVTFLDNAAVGTIENTDKAQISVSSPSAPEASGAIDFTVSITNPVDVAVSVDFSTVAGGTAIVGTDYDTITGQLVNFAANSTVSQTVTVTVHDETLVELDETINVLLDDEMVNGRNVNVVPGGVGTILNDDQAIIVIDNVTDEEGDSGTTKFDFTVSMSNDVDVPVTMNYSTRAASATVADDDYTQGLGVVTFPAGPIPADQLVRVIVQGDTKFEPTEEFFVDLGMLNAMGRNVVFGDPEGRGRILNDDILINGACCFENGVCADLIPLDCVIAGGVFQGTSTFCFQIDCPLPPTGACCFFNGQCFISTEFDCTANGGFYQGDGTPCIPGVCVAGDTSDRASGTEKGSLLFIHAVELRWTANAPYGLIQDTFVSLTNDYPEDVQVQMYFINGDPPTDAVLDPNTGDETERSHSGWNWVNNGITLTGNEPAYWSALTGNPKGVSPFTILDPGDPPGRPAPDGSDERVLRGYIIAWAVNNVRHEIRWNHLSAAATAVRYDNTTAWEYGATSFAVVDGAAMNGETTGTPGVLNLDGNEYTASFSQLLLNFQAAESGGFSSPPPTAFTIVSDTDLTLHPVSADLRQSNDGPVTTKASFDVWNENETKFSGTHRCITCWDQTLISDYEAPNHLVRMFLQTDHGKARIDGVRSTVCDDPVSGRFSRDAAILGVAARYLAINGGVPGGSNAAAGGNLWGMGFEPAIIRQDVSLAPPDEADEDGTGYPALPQDPTAREIEDFLNDFVEKAGK